MIENTDIFIDKEEMKGYEEGEKVAVEIKSWVSPKNSPEGKIVIEDKCNHEKYFSDEYQSNEIFKASDLMVDSLTQLISRSREKKPN